jgi:cation diffusion facilitator family transporter
MISRRLLIPGLLTLVAAIVTILLRYVAYHLTGSVSLFADAAESLVNLLAATTALLSLIYASRPVDINHTYGHEKIEYFSSGLEGLLILGAAVATGWFAAIRLFSPTELEHLDIGMAVAFVASLINLGVSLILRRAAQRQHSIVLEASSKHLLADFWTSLGILAGVGLVWLTGIRILDPIVGLIVVLNIGWTGFDLIRRSFNELMDHALSDEEQQKVRAAIQTHLDPNMDFHALRTRRAGARRFADFHLLVPGDQSVHEAHAVASRIEEAVEHALPGIEVTVHIEPIEESASYQDSALLPIERAARREREQVNLPGSEEPE